MRKLFFENSDSIKVIGIQKILELISQELSLLNLNFDIIKSIVFWQKNFLEKRELLINKEAKLIILKLKKYTGFTCIKIIQKNLSNLMFVIA